MKGMLLCHTRKCAHRSFHVSVSSSRVSAFWQTFHFGSKQIQYDESISACALLRKYSSSVLLFRWVLLLQMQNYAQLRRLSVRAEWRAAGQSQSRIRHAFVACRKVNQNCVNYLNMSPKILWKIPISTPFGSKATEEDEGRGGILKWSRMRILKSAHVRILAVLPLMFSIKVFFLESELEKIMRLFWVFCCCFSHCPGTHWSHNLMKAYKICVP